MNITEKQQKRIRRHLKIRSQVNGTRTRPRLAVFKSNKHFSAQLINDEKGETIAAVSSLSKKDAPSSKLDADALGKEIAEKAKKINIQVVVFDRGGFIYAGKIKAFADSARKAGLKF